MIRFVFRIISMVFLAIAVMYAVIDSARSIADGALTLTTIGETAALAAPDALARLGQQVSNDDHPFLTTGMLASIVTLPTSLLALGLALLFYLIGRQPSRRKGRFSLQ